MTKERQRIVDVDVHHGYSQKSDLFPYLSRYYAQRFDEYGLGIDPTSYANNGGVKGRRADLAGDDGLKPGVMNTAARDAEGTRQQLLDECGVDVAILTGGIGQAASAMRDMDYANALCRAFNDYSIEHWVAKDDRFRYALHINVQDPVSAAAEIDRLGPRKDVCAVMVGCGSSRPFGYRLYHPVLEACERNSLALTFHFGNEGIGTNPPPSAAGYPSHYIEGRQLRASYYLPHIASLVFDGAFEKFPKLKVGVLESGFAWVPPAMRKMDLDWKGLRAQTPWVSRPPSEYIKKHVRFATQPMEEPSDPEALPKIIEWMGGASMLMFASDYPHWDWDAPQSGLSGLTPEERTLIYSQNAIDTFNLVVSSHSQAA